MTFLRVLRSKYDQFSGRADRREFWRFWLVLMLLGLIAGYVDSLIEYGGTFEAQGFGISFWYPGYVTGILFTATFVPVLGLGARRLHDVGRSGWWQVLMLAWPVAYGLVSDPGSLAAIGTGAEWAYGGGLGLFFLAVATVGTATVFIFGLLPGGWENAYGLPGQSADRPAVLWTVLTTRYAKFAGRAGRKEFWLFMLVSGFTVGGIAGNLDQWFFTDPVSGNSYGPIAWIWTAATIVPMLALGARRLHDTGRSGRWQWLWLTWIPAAAAGVGIGAQFADIDENDLESVALAVESMLSEVIGLAAIMIVFGIAAIVCSILLLVWFLMPSNQDENSYGEPPVAPAYPSLLDSKSQSRLGI